MEKIIAPNFSVSASGNDISSYYQAQLLTDLGAQLSVSPTIDNTIGHSKAAIEGIKNENRWQDSGLKNITGTKERPLLNNPVHIAEFADGALEALRAISGQLIAPEYRGGDLLALRAAFTGGSRQGSISLGGSCRILPCVDGTIAVNLSRESDWELLDAWLLTTVSPNWTSVERQVRELPKAHLLEQGRLLGIAVADANPAMPNKRSWYDLVRSVKNNHQTNKPNSRRQRPPRVIDLSSLWAGPLCSQLLRWCGADVIKVESDSRPDGARFGSHDFFEFLNTGKKHKTLELDKKNGVVSLLELIRSADIVIEGSRPRALQQMGIIAEDLVSEVPGLTWISITGYGRKKPQANWIAYGDDAGVEGGLSAEIYKGYKEWMFCGDAIADPLTGMHAALVAYASWMSGGGHMLSLSLVQTVQNCVLTQRHLDQQSQSKI